MSSFLGTDGADTISPDHVSPGVAVTPGLGNSHDLMLGGHGDDSLSGGAGRDTLVGGRGDDTIEGGTGNDLIVWSNRDGNDSVAGGSGFDTLVFQGDPRGQWISLFDGFDALSIFDDRSLTFMDTNGLERVEIHGGGSTGYGDFVQISDLSETGLQEVLVSFAPGGRDEIAFVGSGEPEELVLSRTLSGNLMVEGLGVTTEIAGFDQAQDRLIISLGEGGDVVDARAFSGANLIVAAGAGDDLGLLGFGDDRWSAVGAPGADTVEGSAGRDTLDLDASIEDDVIILAGNATEATASHAGDTILLRDFERMEIESATGADLIDASGLSGIQLLAYGSWGEDTIIGGARGDLIEGGAQSDRLTGGGGRDRFVLGRENTNGIVELDTVTDYAAGDIIDLRGSAGGYAAEVTAEGLMLTFAAGDMDQIMLQGVTSLAAVDIWI